MKLGTSDGDEGDNDSDRCPYCRAWLYDLAEDVTDDDWRNTERDVASVDCLSCGKTIALVRTHDYHLHKFKEAPALDAAGAGEDGE